MVQLWQKILFGSTQCIYIKIIVLAYLAPKVMSDDDDDDDDDDDYVIDLICGGVHLWNKN